MAEEVVCVLVQYVALRGDLLRVDKWPIGAIVAQACHASTAVLHQFKDDPSTQQYLKDLDHMRKVVLEVSTNFPNRTISLCNIIDIKRRAPSIYGITKFTKIYGAIKFLLS